MQEPNECPKCKSLLTVNYIRGGLTDCSCASCKAIFHIRNHRTGNGGILYFLAEINPAHVNQPTSFDGMTFDEIGQWLENSINNQYYTTFHPYHVAE